MASYPYTSNPGRIKEFLKKIQGLGIPSRVTLKYIESLGYTGRNDRNLVAVLKAIGFVDGNGAPTDTWKKFRNTSASRHVLASAIQRAYAPLFETYPDAWRQDQEALRNFFSSHTDVGEGALKYMAATFRSLCELADFDAQTDEGLDADSASLQGQPPEDKRISRPVRLSTSTGAGLTVNINVQLQIPDTDNEDTYERFFAAMKKHLLS